MKLEYVHRAGLLVSRFDFNPRLKVNRNFNCSCIKMFFTSFAWSTLRLQDNLVLSTGLIK